MHNSDDLFSMLFRTVLKNFFVPNNSGNPKDNRAENEMMLAALGLLAFVGADALMVVFRKNFGARGLSLFRVVLAFLAFGILSVAGYVLSRPDSAIDPRFGTRPTYLVASVFYALFGLYVLVMGIRHRRESARLPDLHLYYTGDSHLLDSLVTKSGWSQANVQTWAEPLLTLAIGGLLTAVNLLWGLPLVFCALSIWGRQIVGYVIGGNPVNERIQRQGYRNSQDDFTQTRF